MGFLLVSSGCYKTIATNLVALFFFWLFMGGPRCMACRTLAPPTRDLTCKPGGLKQHKWIILQFWGSEVQNGSQWAKNPLRVCRAVLLLEAVEEDPFPCLFQILDTACIPWLVALSSTFRQQWLVKSFSLWPGSPPSLFHL